MVREGGGEERRGKVFRGQHLLSVCTVCMCVCVGVNKCVCPPFNLHSPFSQFSFMCES
jgi:hypothetical protein